MEHNFKWKNDGRTKVMIGCGTRPEIIRLAAVIRRCREYFDTCVVYYNQNWDRNLSTVFWEDFELKNTFGEFGPDILVPVVGDNLALPAEIFSAEAMNCFQNCSLTPILSLEIQTAVCQLSPLKDFISRFSIWKQETDVRTSASRRKQTEE